MKIIFVGIHNKPGMKPLDSKTFTGKAVDSIMHKLPHLTFQKTNLCDTDHFPKDDDIPSQIKGYMDRVEFKTGDVFVLLGAWVNKNFPNLYGYDIVKISHPSSFPARKDQKKYIENAVNKISRALVKRITS